MDFKLKDDERIDDLKLKNLKIVQRKNGFCFGIDSVLLSDFAKKIKKDAVVMDLGTGTGVIPILLCAKTNLQKVVGVELQKKVYEMARKSIVLNKLQDKFEIVNEDILNLTKMYEKNSFDVIVTNPPYKKRDTGLLNDKSEKAISRHEMTATLEDFISVSNDLLKDKGELYMVNRPERLADVLTLMQKYNIEPKVLRFVYSKIYEPPKLILVKGIKNANEFLKVEKNLYIYNEAGEYTEEINEIYNKSEEDKIEQFDSEEDKEEKLKIEIIEEQENMLSKNKTKKGELYIVATPIGNLDDITARAVQVLNEVDLVAAEDTRHTIKLLNHLDILKPLISYHRHNEENRSEILLEELQKGTTIALVSDAGTPGICDPGEEIIKKCIEEGINIIPIPGACAMINALVASGIDTSEFTFLGFLPLNKKNRKEKLNEIKNTTKTAILYEAPHKIKETLQDLKEIIGERKIVLARELTKIHEEFIRGSIDELIEKAENLKGEMVLIIQGSTEKKENSLNFLTLEEHYEYYEKQGFDKKEIIKKIAKDRNTNKNEIYQKFMKKEV